MPGQCFISVKTVIPIGASNSWKFFNVFEGDISESLGAGQNGISAQSKKEFVNLEAMVRV